MKTFNKYIVNDQDVINSIMHFAIGGSWDMIVDEKKYPRSLPAMLIIDEDTKHFDYVYPDDFDSTREKIYIL